MDDNREVIFCRICLRIDLTQKYMLSDIAQRKFIETLFKDYGYHKDLEEHSYACFECRSLLHRSYNFIQKALRAQIALYELQEKQEPLTHSLLESLDREKYNINSNLVSSEPKTYVLQSLETVFKHEDDVIVKTEPSEAELNSSSVSTFDQNSSKYQPDLSSTCEIDSKNNILIESYKRESTTDDAECIPNYNSYIDPFCNTDVKTEPEICIMHDDDASIEENYSLENFDPIDKNLAKDCERESPDIQIISSDDNYTDKKVAKHKGKKKRKKDTKKLIPKRKVTLDLFSSDDKVKVKRKRTKVEWPKMPIFEERFRNRKNVTYRGFDVEKEKKERDDDDFLPAGEDSSDNSCDSYDDEGRVIKRKKDTREFPLECEECQGIITSKQEHQYHYLKMHRDVEYPYKVGTKYVLCPECGKTFAKNRMKEHENKHAGIKTECDICHKEYSSKMSMIEHKKRVHQRGTRVCVCDYCKREFFNTAELLRHIRTHTGEKPFKCHLCDHRVAHKGNLHVHVRKVHQHMASTTKKKPKQSRKDSKQSRNNSEDRSGKKKKTKQDQIVSKGSEKNLEENSSAKEKDSSSRKIKDSGKKKRKRKRKVATDSDTE